MPIFESDRLTFHKFGDDDAPFILELLNDPAFLQHIGDKNVRTLDDARDYMRNGPQASYEKLGFGLSLVRLKDDKTRIGMCGLLKRDTLPHADIGYAFLPQFRGKGYASEATAATVELAKNTLNLDTIVAIVSRENAASIRVLEKLGLRFEKMICLEEGGDECMYFAPISNKMEVQ